MEIATFTLVFQVNHEWDTCTPSRFYSLRTHNGWPPRNEVERTILNKRDAINAYIPED